MIENERVIRVAMSRWLGEASYRVESVESGKEALDKLTASQYDLLLVDLRLPRMDGLQFLKEAREMNSRAGAVMITGYGSMGRVVKCMDEGALGFIIKPFYPEQLLQSVQDALTKQSFAREKQRQNALKPILGLSRILMENGDLSTFAHMFLPFVSSATGADKAAIMILKGDGLDLLAATGFDEVPTAPDRGEVREMEKVLQHMGDSLMSVGGAFSWPHLEVLGNEPAHELCVPLQLLGNVNGLVVVGKKGRGQAFSQSDIEFLWICCAVASSAVANFIAGSVPAAFD